MTQTKSGGVITRQYEYNAKGEQVHAYLWSNGSRFTSCRIHHRRAGPPSSQRLWPIEGWWSPCGKAGSGSLT